MGTFRRLWTNLDKDEKEQLANRMETSVNYLSQVAHGHKKPGKQFIALLEIRLGICREELFAESGETARQFSAGIDPGRLILLQGKIGLDRQIDRSVLQEALAWYGRHAPESCGAPPESMMHTCKDALMQSTGLSKEACWVHAALAWDLAFRAPSSSR